MTAADEYLDEQLTVLLSLVLFEFLKTFWKLDYVEIEVLID